MFEPQIRNEFSRTSFANHTIESVLKELRSLVKPFAANDSWIEEYINKHLDFIGAINQANCAEAVELKKNVDAMFK